MKLLFFDNSTYLKSVLDLESGARGGMISSLFRVTDDLSKMGHNVSVLSDIEKKGTTKAGVRWGDDVVTEGGSWDVIIMNRTITDDGFARLKTKHRVLWTHDLPHSGFIPHPKMINAFSRVVFMSHYAEQIWRTFYPDIKKSALIPNGVDKELFYPRTKDYNYLIFGSAPNRGLRYLPLIFEALNNRVSAELRMNAYSNMRVLHPNEDDRATRFWEAEMPTNYKECEDSGINLKDPIPQKKWAEELGKASLMLMPTAYPEICSNVVLQSLASGTPIVTTGNMGSVGEWIKNGYNGFLTKYQLCDYMVHTLEIVRGAKTIVENPRLHRKMCKNAAKTRNILSWEQVSKKWDKMIGGL